MYFYEKLSQLMTSWNLGFSEYISSTKGSSGKVRQIRNILTSNKSIFNMFLEGFQISNIEKCLA